MPLPDNREPIRAKPRGALGSTWWPGVALEACAYVGMGLLCAVGLHRFFYPAWTWRGFLHDIRAAATITGVVVILVMVVWQSVQIRRAELRTREGVRRFWRGLAPGWLFSIAVLIDLTAGVALFRLLPAPSGIEQVIRAVDLSDWPRAREELNHLRSLPLEPGVLESAEGFVRVYELSESNRPPANLDFRQLLIRSLELLQRGVDPDRASVLTQAEAAKVAFLVDGNADGLHQAIDRLDSALAHRNSTTERARLLSKKGQLLLVEHSYEAASRAFEEALLLEDSPTRLARVLVDLASAERGLGDWDSALLRYRAAEGDYPQTRRFTYYSDLGQILLHLRRYTDAKKAIQEALSRRPDDWPSYMNLALVHDALGEYDTARTNYEIVIKAVESPDVRRAAQVLAGRSIEQASGDRVEAFLLYMAACGNDASRSMVARQLQSAAAQREVYACAAEVLARSRLSDIESTLDWFRTRERPGSTQPDRPRPAARMPAPAIATPAEPVTPAPRVVEESAFSSLSDPRAADRK